MKEIAVRPDYRAKCWTATFYTNGEDDAYIVSLFGTSTIPTAFTLKADVRDVLSAIRAKNPDAHVYQM